MALTKIDDRGLKTPIDLLDNEKIRLGTGNDLQIYHDGSKSVIDNSNGVGNLILYANGTNSVVIQPVAGENSIVANSNSSVELFFDNSKKLETLTNGIKVEGNIFMDDNDEIRLGDSGDFQLFHNSTTGEARIFNSNAAGINIITDLFNVKNNANNETLLKATNGGAVELYHDNSKKFETTSYGVEITGGLELPDSAGGTTANRLKIGAGDDLQLFHNGTNSIISNSTGDLSIRSDNNIVFMDSGANETFAKFIDNGVVELYHDNSKKFETTSTGIKVEGDNVEIYKYRSYNSDAAIYQKIGTNNDAVDNNKVHQWRFGLTGNASAGNSFVFSNLRNNQTSYTEELRLHPDGGISFNGDTAASTALDDYEEGSWTPTITGGAITTNGAYYTKIGRVVHWYLYGHVTNTANNGTQFRIYGLPFTVGGNSTGLQNYYGNVATFNYTASANNSGLGVLSPLAHGAQTYIYFHFIGVGDPNPPVNSYWHSHMLNQAFIMSGVYFV